MSESVEQILQHGLTLHRWGQTEMASQMYITVLNADPQQPEANYNMGLLSVGSGRPQNALEFFETALESNADIADYWVSYINTLLEVGRIGDAQAVFDQAKINGARGDGFDKLQYKLSEASEKSSKISNGGIYEKQKLPSILDSLNLLEAMRLARKKAKEGLPESAASIYQDILYKFPNNKKARHGIKSLSVGLVKPAPKVQDPPQDQLQALIELCSRGLLEQALKQAEKLIQRFSMSAILFNIQGIILKDMKKFDLSRLAFEKAVALMPNFADAYNNMGNAFKAQGELEKAIVAYNKALAINPNYASGYYNLGVVLTEQGKLEEAVETYKQALVINPAYVDAYYNLGNALKDQGKLEQAIGAYSKALAIKPDDADILNNLGITFKEQGKLEKAIETFNMAIAIRPDYVEAYNNIGLTIIDCGKPKQAIEAYNKALAIKPDYADAYNNMGNAFKAQGELEKAIVAYNKALAINPNYASGYYNLGVVLTEQGKLEEAVETYKQALVINPAYVDAYYNLGSALKDQGKLEQAIEVYSKALAIKPDDADILNNMGVTLKGQGELEKAIETFKMALNIKPDYAEAYNNLGVALKEQGKLEEAVEIYKKALLIKPDFADAYTNMGNALKDQGKLEQAIKTLNKAIAISPDDAEAHHYLSFALLNTGRLKEGLDESEWRWKVKSDVSGERRFLQPSWDGKVSLENKSILVWCEQGIGDIIRCSSLLPLISSQAQHCILECPQKIIPLFSQSFPNVEVRPENRSLDLKRDDFDFQLPTGSLHKHFLSEVTSNTRPSAYLVPDPIRVNFWKSRLSSLGSGPYVGISWKSSLMQGERLKFYAPVSDWRPLLKLENTTFINLQYADAENDLIQIRDEYGVTVHNFDDLDQYNNLADVAALCAALDCVVSISNAVPTISAGVGTPTKYAVPAIYDWDNIIGNPVGPTVDIFKRNRHSRWSNVFELIAEDIAKL